MHWHIASSYYNFLDTRQTVEYIYEEKRHTHTVGPLLSRTHEFYVSSRDNLIRRSLVGTAGERPGGGGSPVAIDRVATFKISFFSGVRVPIFKGAL